MSAEPYPPIVKPECKVDGGMTLYPGFATGG
jgi:hypothetical protein